MTARPFRTEVGARTSVHEHRLRLGSADLGSSVPMDSRPPSAREQIETKTEGETLLMSDGIKDSLTRRNALRGAAAAGAIGAMGALAARASAATSDHQETRVGPLRVRKQLQLVDDEGQQRFLHQSSKPPVLLNGEVIPAEQRSGPDDASYFIFNDENQSEKGGIIVDSSVAQLSFDYPNVDALHLSAENVGSAGVAQLSMRQMPDPSIPPAEVTPEDSPQRVLLATDNVGDGALLFLYDSKGRPRITLQVDGEDVPRIQILDGDGNVVSELPPTEETPTRSKQPELSPLLGAKPPSM